MPQRIIKALSTPTAKSTAIYYFGSFTLSILRYFFHLILLRFLAPAEYGEFLSYLSLTYLLGVPMGTIGTVVTKFVSGFKGKNDNTSINLFFYYLLKSVSPISFILGLLLILFSGPLAIIFKAHTIAFVVLGVSIFISVFQTIIGSYLIAFQKFIFQTITGFIGVILTIILSIIFIHFGFSATGAVLGQLLSNVIISIIIFWSLKPFIYPKLAVKKSPKFSLKGFLGYSFIFALGTASLVSTDVLMVRSFFNPHISGIYSSLSILGRMILFGLTPISAIVLPIAAHRHSATGSARGVLVKLGSVILLFGLIGASIFSLVPELIIKILSGAAYLEAAPYLSIFAFTMVFFAISQFILGYLMAIGKAKANFLLLAATLLQPLLIYLSKTSLPGVIWANFSLQLGLVLSLTVALFYRRT